MLATLLGVAVFVFGTAVVIGCCLTLSGALRQCAPEVRKLTPELVWLLLFPIINVVWVFVVVIRASQSLSGEFERRGLATPGETYGRDWGLALAACQALNLAVSFVPYPEIVRIPGKVLGYAPLVLWLVYWSIVAKLSGILKHRAELETIPQQESTGV